MITQNEGAAPAANEDGSSKSVTPPSATVTTVTPAQALVKKSWRDQLSVHPAANEFPMMPEEELRALGEDIKKNGLKSRIVLWKEQKHFSPVLLDGRNRLDAIEAVIGGIRVEQSGTDGDPAIELWMKPVDGSKFCAHGPRMSPPSANSDLPFVARERWVSDGAAVIKRSNLKSYSILRQILAVRWTSYKMPLQKSLQHSVYLSSLEYIYRFAKAITVDFCRPKTVAGGRCGEKNWRWNMGARRLCHLCHQICL